MIHHLEDALNEALAKVAKNELSNDVIADAEMRVADVTWETYRMLERLAPFGMDNPQPVFVFKNCTIQNIEQFGAGKAHVKLSMMQDGMATQGLAFFSTPESFTKPPSAGEPADIVGSIEASYFRGRGELRIRLVDIF